MSNELSAQDLLPPEIGLNLLGFEKSEQGSLVRAEGRTRSECPSCRTQSTARHSRYWRQLQDLPVQGKRVELQLRLSRWRCRRSSARRTTGATSCRPLSFVGLRRVGEFHFTSFACQFWGSVNLIVISLRMGTGFPFNSSGV
jgi:zinc-finger of transposase IS204/IS1001/IS1096/IS1165